MKKDETVLKLNKMLAFHRQRKYLKTVSFCTMDIPHTGKQTFFFATNVGLSVSIYHLPQAMLVEYVEELFSNKKDILN